MMSAAVQSLAIFGIFVAQGVRHTAPLGWAKTCSVLLGRSGTEESKRLIHRQWAIHQGPPFVPLS